MTDGQTGVEKFERAADLLARNGSIQQIETGMGEADAEGNVLSLTGRVHIQGIYREEEVKDWLTMRDPSLGVKTVPSDVFEEFEDGMATYVGIHDIDADIGAEPDY